MGSIDKLVSILPQGKENACTRLYVSQAMEKGDRECRDLKQKAILQGYPIATSSNYPGLWIATDVSDIIQARSEQVHRIKEIKKLVEAYDRIIETWDQHKIDELV